MTAMTIDNENDDEDGDNNAEAKQELRACRKLSHKCPPEDIRSTLAAHKLFKQHKELPSGGNYEHMRNLRARK